MRRAILPLILILSCISLDGRVKKSLIPQVSDSAELAKLRSSLDSLRRQNDSLRLALDAASARQERVEVTPSPRIPDIESTDSLARLWHSAISFPFYDSVHAFDIEKADFSSNVPDSVMSRRLADINAFITLPFNDIVKRYMVMYSEKMPTQMKRVMGLSRYYFPIFEEAFSRHGLPLELKYMAVIESMLKPGAVSRAGAAGLWQFMYRTARGYGLNIDSYIDERFDTEKAAEAAARYMEDAFRTFGDWNLAICSYNCGIGNVMKAIRRSGSREFWQIYDFLPTETRGYVPAFVGVMYAMNYWREYGLVPAEVGIPASTDTLMIRRKLHFTQVSDVVGVPLDEIREFNAQYIHDIVPGTPKQPCSFRLPTAWIPGFLSAEQDSLYLHRYNELLGEDVLKEELKKETAGSRTPYKVRSGDCLGRIASRYGVSVANLKRWNNLKSNNIRVGQVLFIYRNGR